MTSRMETVSAEVVDEVGAGEAARRLVRDAAGAVVAALEGRPPPLEVAVSLVADDRMRRLNREFRRVDRPTDVLAFPLLDDAERAALRAGRVPAGNPPGGPVSLGDVVINLPEARRAARRYGHGERRELAFLVAHGLLHLLGFDHDSPQAEGAMRDLSERALERLGLARGAGR